MLREKKLFLHPDRRFNKEALHKEKKDAAFHRLNEIDDTYKTWYNQPEKNYSPLRREYVTKYHNAILDYLSADTERHIQATQARGEIYDSIHESCKAVHESCKAVHESCKAVHESYESVMTMAQEMREMEKEILRQRAEKNRSQNPSPQQEEYQTAKATEPTENADLVKPSQFLPISSAVAASAPSIAESTTERKYSALLTEDVDDAPAEELSIKEEASGALKTSAEWSHSENPQLFYAQRIKNQNPKPPQNSERDRQRTQMFSSGYRK